MDYPFRRPALPERLAVLKRLRAAGKTVILTDGDVVFQPRKVDHAGLAKVADGDVLIYIHKEEALGDVERRFQPSTTFLWTDKLRILTAAKKIWGSARDDCIAAPGSVCARRESDWCLAAADLTIERIGDLLDYDLGRLQTAALTSSLKVTR